MTILFIPVYTKECLLLSYIYVFVQGSAITRTAGVRQSFVLFITTQCQVMPPKGYILQALHLFIRCVITPEAFLN